MLITIRGGYFLIYINENESPKYASWLGSKLKCYIVEGFITFNLYF